MIFKINEKTSVELKYSFRINIYFEQVAGYSINYTNMSSNDVMNLFFCCVEASLQKAKLPLITMEEFMDAIDDHNGGERIIIDFANWFIEQVQKQYDILMSTEGDPNEVKKMAGGPQAAKKKN